MKTSQISEHSGISPVLIRQLKSSLTNSLIVCYLFATAAFSQATLFPGVYGDALIDSLRLHYKPVSTAGYTNARNLMFTEIDNHNDSVVCVYTAYRIYLDHNSTDPIQEALARQVNTEHTWPQSLGASGQAKSDLHHIFPTWTVANSDRGNEPFAEIPDADTDRWYRFNHYQSSIPAQFIDEYSEEDFDDAVFEPREDHKGNVARAIYYFFTMYREQADSSFFYSQAEELRRWNVKDPVDSAEFQRTNLIAQYQDGKPNPFVLDTTLIGRAYFPPTGLKQVRPAFPDDFRLMPGFPNPFNSRITVCFYLAQSGSILFELFDVNGRRVQRHRLNDLVPGQHDLRISGDELSSGVYILTSTFRGQRHSQKILLVR